MNHDDDGGGKFQQGFWAIIINFNIDVLIDTYLGYSVGIQVLLPA